MARELDALRTARYAILDLGVDDLSHLGDADSYLPTIPEDQRHSLALQALGQLIGEGLVQLYFGRTATTDVVPIPREQVSAVINNPDLWDPTKDMNRQSYSFMNTDLGDKVYHSGLV